jgi:FixJ family two-component response regulator
MQRGPGYRGSGYIVAIVDDDAAMREALARLLRIHGIESRSYPAARAFLATLTSNLPNCLIVDIDMPGMDGMALQRELLNRSIRIPTIVITASDDENIAAKVLSVGARALLRKPLAQDALLTAINSVKGEG